MDKISFEMLLKEYPEEKKVSRESIKACIDKLVEENTRLRTELIEMRAKEAKKYEDLQRETSLEIKRLKLALKAHGDVVFMQE